MPLRMAPMRILQAPMAVCSASLGNDRRLAIALGLANVVVAGLQFLDPVLFGRVIGDADRARIDMDAPDQRVGAGEARLLLILWLAVGAAAIAGEHGDGAAFRADGASATGWR